MSNFIMDRHFRDLPLICHWWGAPPPKKKNTHGIVDFLGLGSEQQLSFLPNYVHFLLVVAKESAEWEAALFG